MSKLSYRDCLLKNIVTVSSDEPEEDKKLSSPTPVFYPKNDLFFPDHQDNRSTIIDPVTAYLNDSDDDYIPGSYDDLTSTELTGSLPSSDNEVVPNLADEIIYDPADISTVLDFYPENPENPDLDQDQDLDLDNLGINSGMSTTTDKVDQPRKYMILDGELNKIRALSSFKNILVEHLIKYFRSHKMYNNGKLKYVRTQMYNHFPNWFFNLNNKGQIVNFLPTGPLDIQENLDYIFRDQGLEKRNDFDTKLLYFNPRYIRDKLITHEIIRNEYFHLVKYELNTNHGNWKLLYITKQQESNLRYRYNGPPEMYDQYVIIMLLRYKFLGGLNNHLSIPPVVYRGLGINMELFGSPFNVSVREYASPFHDIEKYFGSQGSFNQITLKSNRAYAANPPYDVKVVLQMSQWLNEQLGRKELTNVVIYLTLPLWRKDFPGYQLLRDSRWFRDEAELGREDYPFLHYFRGKLIPASDTYLMIMSTENNTRSDLRYNCGDVIRLWPQIRSNFTTS